MMKLVVLSCMLAAASAVSPLLYGGYVAPLAYSAPLLQPYNYRGPLSLAPGQPANILGADGRPLDTLDVNLDRSAHLTAKALDGFHVLKKRSAPLIGAPFAYSAPLGYSAVTTPLAYSAVAAPLAYSAALVQPSNYRGPLSLAPGQPANILAADGRPLDTLDVNLDRSAHFTAKALDGVHVLKKRSAPLIAAPLAYSAPLGYSAVATPLAYSAVAAPLAYSAALVQPSNYRGPLSLAPGQPANILAADGRPLDTLDVNLDRSAHLTAKALEGLHVLKKRSVAVAPLAYTSVAHAPLLTRTYAAPVVATPLVAARSVAYAAPLAHVW